MSILGTIEKIQNHGPGLCRRLLDHVDDPAPCVLGIEVNPRTCAADDKGTRRIVGLRVSSLAYKTPRARITSEEDHRRSRCVGDQHDQCTGYCKEQPLQKSQK